MQLKPHDITLKGQTLTLRPMTENDWDILLKWNSISEVLYYAEGDDVSSRTLDDIQGIYRTTSQTAFCFIIELNGKPIGECWLQKMNLERILKQFPDTDCRRIDLMIGEMELWGRGLGTEAIRLLTNFAFEQERADYVFGCEVADYNPHSQKAFQKAGFKLYEKIEYPPGLKARFGLDFIIANPRAGRKSL
jgi:RimJ/RimL family protein N-acetyltransferase